MFWNWCDIILAPMYSSTLVTTDLLVSEVA